MSLDIHHDGPVVRITLNRPDVRNAFNEQLIARGHELGGVGRSGRRRKGGGAPWRGAHVLRRRGPGLDVADGRTTPTTRTCATRGRSAECSPRLNGCRSRSSAGFTAPRSAAAPDWPRSATSSIAAEDAMFGFTEVKLGILPAVISPYVIAKIGQSAARELFLTGARFSAARAREIGLVHAIGDEAELDRIVAKYVNDILTSAPEAVAAAKRLIADVAHKRARSGARADGRRDCPPARVAGGPGGHARLPRQAHAGVDRTSSSDPASAGRQSRRDRVARDPRVPRDGHRDRRRLLGRRRALRLHVRAADFAVRIGPAPASESYLNIGAVIDAARTHRRRRRPSRLRLPVRERARSPGVRAMRG